MLYRQSGVLPSDGETLAYEVKSEEHLDHNWENYLEVISDTDEFDCLVGSLYEQIVIENDDNGLIERWARVRTYPHTACSALRSNPPDAMHLHGRDGFAKLGFYWVIKSERRLY